MTLFKNALYLAWMDVRARYKKSVLGPLWMTIGNFIGILGLSIVWSALLKENPQTFIPSLSIGFIVWQLVSISISESSTTFVREAKIIRNITLPTWFFATRFFARHIINLLHNFIIIIILIWNFNIPITFTTWLVIPNLLIVLLNLYWITYIIGILGARFRDIEYLINSFLPILFFISPVVFHPGRLPEEMEVFIWLNPLSYFIEMVRSPILGEVPRINTYTIMLGLLTVGALSTYWFNKNYVKRLAFWI